MKTIDERHREVVEHIGLLYTIAIVKTGNTQDAEDIVQESCLSAIRMFKRGKEIANVKAYLLKVLERRYYAILRNKYKFKTLCNGLSDNYIIEFKSRDDGDKEILKSEVAEIIRRELAYLSKMHRDVMELYYMRKMSVADIAKQLEISEELVYKRISRGKEQMRDGVINREKYMRRKKEEEYLSIGFSGIAGLRAEPESVLTNAIEQNILIAACEKPMSPAEIGKRLGIPTNYIEEFVEKLVKHEFMSVMAKNKVRTEFVIVDYEQFESKLEIVKDFANDTFDEVKSIFSDLVNEYKKLGCLSAFNETQLYLYAVISLSSNIQFYLIDTLNLLKIVDYPNRSDGGKWIIDIGFKNKLSKTFTPHLFLGGPRTLVSEEFKLVEYDTAIGKTFRADLSHNFTNSERVQLFCDIVCGQEIEPKYVPLIPDLSKLGFIDDDMNVLIPAISRDDYGAIEKVSNEYSKKIIKVIGKKLINFVKNNPLEHPKWIKSNQFFIHIGYLSALPMNYVFRAAERGIIEIEEDKTYPICVIIRK